MRILMTVNAAWNIRNFRRPLLDKLLERGDQVCVLAPPDDAVPDLKAVGVDFVPLEMDNKGLNPLRDAHLALKLYRNLRAQRPDVVLSWTIKNNIYGAFAARLAGVPFLPNVSGLGTAFLSGGTLQWVAETLYRGAFAQLETVFFQNEEDRALFLSRGLVTQGQAKGVPGSGIDLHRFVTSPPPDGPPVFLMIARLLRDKGVIEYVDAARRVRMQHPDALFRLIGAADSNNRSAISRAEVQGWQDEGIVEYLGTADDVRPHIARAHCVVLPSYREGAPRTLIEGAAMARPLIATDVPGCRSVVEDGHNGLLCAPRSGQALAEAFTRFLALPEAERSAMGLAGRQKMQDEFDQAIVVNAYLRAIDSAVGRG